MREQHLLWAASVVAVLLSGAQGASGGVAGSCLVPDPHQACRLSVGIGAAKEAGVCNDQPARPALRMSVIAEARARQERLQLCPQATWIESFASMPSGAR